MKNSFRNIIRNIETKMCKGSTTLKGVQMRRNISQYVDIFLLINSKCLAHFNC